MYSAILDALFDALKTLPFLVLIYIVIEIYEHGERDEKIKKVLSGKTAPVYGSLLSVIPECGLSVMCARLYAGGLIGTGTMLAVFLSSSDEGLIVLISGGASVLSILSLIGIKTAFAIAVGFVINFVIKRDTTFKQANELECTVCHEKSKNVLEEYLLHPFLHALKIFACILVVNICFSLLFYFIGEDKIMTFLDGRKELQPIICALVGLIPNCASSVIISQAFLNGGITFAGLIAGLSANAGVGLTAIFKDKKRIGESVLLIATLYLLSVVLGYICYFIRL